MARTIRSEECPDLKKLKELLESEDLVTVTENGKPSWVMMKKEQYEKLTGEKLNAQNESEEEKNRREMIDTLSALRNQYW